MDDSVFEAWCAEQEFAFTKTPKQVKDIWNQLFEEYDIPDEDIVQIVDKLFTLGKKEGR